MLSLEGESLYKMVKNGQISEDDMATAMLNDL